MSHTIEDLARALAVCVAHAQVNGTEFRIVRNPWALLTSATLDQTLVAPLVAQGYLQGKGGLTFAIVRDTIVQPVVPVALPTYPRYVLILDAENAARSCEQFGEPFTARHINDAVRDIGGRIVLRFAYATVEALSRRTREDLLLAGFHTIDCITLPNGAEGGKNVTDEYLQDLIRRLLELNAMDGIILVTDDRGFAPTMHAVIDSGKRMVRVSYRHESVLDSIGEVIRISLAGDAQPAGAEAALWEPGQFLDDLHALTIATDERDHRARMRAIRTRVTLPYRFLRSFVRWYFVNFGREQTYGFLFLLSRAMRHIRNVDRDAITNEILHEFLDAVITTGAFRTIEQPAERGTKRSYGPNWDHPFCAAAIADIPAERAGGSSRRKAAATHAGQEAKAQDAHVPALSTNEP
ncbi:MAG: NYN domain-containing protein [bacterium]|nr:NYN domain-containing protein [bacterium]